MRSSTAASRPSRGSRSAAARKAPRMSTGCATRAPASTCATPRSSSTYSSACTARTSSPALGSAWRSCTAWSRAMADGYGPRAGRMKAPASFSRCRRRPDDDRRTNGNPACGRQRRGRGNDHARPEAEQPGEQAALGEGRRRGARLPVLRRQIRRARAAQASQDSAPRHQDAQGGRHRGVAAAEGKPRHARDSRRGHDLVERGARRGGKLPARCQQLYRQAGAVRGVSRDCSEDRPVLGDHQPRAAMTAAPPIRVLLTEDVVADAELEMRELKRAGMRIAHRVAQTEESFVEALHDFDPVIILSDFSMPGFDGMAALALARELCPETPFIFVSGTIGEEYAIRALRNGATDYVLKTNLVRLPAAVERALADAHQRERLVRLSRIRDIASGVNSALVRLRERAALFEEICRIAVEVGRFSGAHVGLLGAGGTLEWMARRGTSVAHLKSATVSISEDMEKARTT